MSAPLSVLSPVSITSSLLVSSTVAETDYSAWSSGATYAAGDRCISASTHKIYESLKAGNINKDPTDATNRSTVNAWWLEVSPTNRYAMFDGGVSTQTSTTSPLTVVLTPGAFNSVYLAGLDADSVSISVKDKPGGVVVYSDTKTLEASNPTDYYEYYFDRFKPLTDYLTSGIDTYNAAEITVTLTKASGNVKCGVLALGDLLDLGKTLSGAQAKPKTYSYIKTDDFGKTTIVKRKAAKDISISARVDIANANTVVQTLTDLLDVPCVWVGTDLENYAGLRVYGLGSGEVSYDDPEGCLLSLTIQGMI